MHYPSNPQPGLLFFKIPRECGIIFGVCSEGRNTQVNYLIQESQSCGKGANSIVSMVHHCLCNFSHAEELCLHADNCVGQNKNNTMVWYIAWRVIINWSKACKLSLMIPGHTRFSPDRFFGLIKRRFRISQVSSLSQIAEVVDCRESSTIGQNQAYIHHWWGKYKTICVLQLVRLPFRFHYDTTHYIILLFSM